MKGEGGREGLRNLEAPMRCQDLRGAAITSQRLCNACLIFVARPLSWVVGSLDDGEALNHYEMEVRREAEFGLESRDSCQQVLRRGKACRMDTKLTLTRAWLCSKLRIVSSMQFPSETGIAPVLLSQS